MKTGIVSNTNYNNSKKQAFTAKIDVNAAKGMIKDGEIKILEGIAAKIGNESDAIKADIGETRYWSTGGPWEGGDDTENFARYSMAVATYIEKKLGIKLFEESERTYNTLRTPFEVLKSFLEQLVQS